MASSVDDDRPTAVDIQRLSSFWDNHGTIHVMDDNTINQSETTAPRQTPDSRPKHERTESTESTASGSSQGSSSSEVDEKYREAGGGNKSEKASATASVTRIGDNTIINSNSRQPSEPPYHVFTKKEKWLVTVIIAVSGLFSPLSSNIYFPALGAIANAIHTDIALVSLTVTIYMAVQAFAPSFWGPLSDSCGRRVTFIGTFVVFLISNIGLAFSKNFAMLMAFRAIQAAGSAATISVGGGVLGDITTAKERGGYMAGFSAVRMFGLSMGPVIGGIITEYLGFHAIFWFLFILGSITLAAILLFLPETLRRIAGNGTVPLKGIHRPFFDRQLRQRYWKERDAATEEGDLTAPPPKLTCSTFFSSLRFIFEKDVLVTLLFGAIVYTVWSMVTSSTTALFQSRFGLSNLQTGLIFLPNGVGCICGSSLSGKIMNRDYKIVESSYRASHHLSGSVEINRKKLADFPISRARLRSSLYFVIPFIICVAGQTGLFNLNSTLMVDLYPGASASASAVNNLVRCLIGAVGVAVVQYIIDAIGAGLTFLIFAIVTAASIPLLWLEWRFGERWRRKRMERLERKKDEKRAGEGGEAGRA
ncbi:major facilitator superfamily domain-containing protein [Pseudoneurospora amorphoporcata]|uniref:Major facilitator superfamily domain-containing protein n=1 Tax=Pseudoneurospora amorphoporcata TaxID=241081 RepID=A0AAN6NLE1_9PEZI|nr:major facilitator superfamily domain-containing protein [Pseudoneurospora amorphoporcata]